MNNKKFVFYDQWTKTIKGFSSSNDNKKLKHIRIEKDILNYFLKSDLYNHIVHEDQLIEKDNYIRLPDNNKIVNTTININYDTAPICLKIFVETKKLKIDIKRSFITNIIDKKSFGQARFLNPDFPLFVYHKENKIGTIDINLNDYLKNNDIEIDTSILLDYDLQHISFKVINKFKDCCIRYFSNPNKTNIIDRNLLEYDYHLIVNNKIEIKNQIIYWEEFNLNDEIIIGFVKDNNPFFVEYFVKFYLTDLKEKQILKFNVPEHVNLTNKTIHCNKKLKVKYENTYN